MIAEFAMTIVGVIGVAIPLYFGWKEFTTDYLAD